MKYYRYKSESSIECILCRHYCTLKEGKSAICGINFNEGGKLVCKVYNHPSALNIDPIEKKPLYHFLPDTKTLSLGTVGCNFRCSFCQNYSISQTANIDKSIHYSPKDILSLALQYKTQSISYTYNEPTIWYPYARDIGFLAKKEGLKNIFVTNGYETNEVLQDMKLWVDAMNIDLKSFSNEYYKKSLKGSLDGVLETLKIVAKSNIHLEVTTLLVPNVNDSKEQIILMAEFIANELGCDVPWHISAFHPDYKMLDTSSTTLNSMKMAQDIAKSFGILHVHLGNIASAT